MRLDGPELKHAASCADQSLAHIVWLRFYVLSASFSISRVTCSKGSPAGKPSITTQC